MPNKKIYIISNDGMDWSDIRYVCGSEKTARQRFKDLKIEMLQGHLKEIMFQIKNYKTYKDDEDLKFWLKRIENEIDVLTRCTFKHRIRVMVDQPTCKIYDLES